MGSGKRKHRGSFPPLSITVPRSPAGRWSRIPLPLPRMLTRPVSFWHLLLRGRTNAALPPSPHPDKASGEDQKPHPGVNAVDWLRRHSSKDAPTQTCRSEEWAMGGGGDQKKCAGLQAQTPCLGDGGGQQRHAWR